MFVGSQSKQHHRVVGQLPRFLINLVSEYFGQPEEERSRVLLYIKRSTSMPLVSGFLYSFISIMFNKNSFHNMIICCSSALVFKDVIYFHPFLSFSKTFRRKVIEATSGTANPVSIKTINSPE